MTPSYEALKAQNDTHIEALMNACQEIAQLRAQLQVAQEWTVCGLHGKEEIGQELDRRKAKSEEWARAWMMASQGVIQLTAENVKLVADRDRLVQELIVANAYRDMDRDTVSRCDQTLHAQLDELEAEITQLRAHLRYQGVIIRSLVAECTTLESVQEDALEFRDMHDAVRAELQARERTLSDGFAAEIEQTMVRAIDKRLRTWELPAEILTRQANCQHASLSKDMHSKDWWCNHCGAVIDERTAMMLRRP